MNTVGRCYTARFSPTKRASQLTAEQVRQSLRTSFETWGLPEAIRVDNGSPWGTQRDVPSALALWLVGLGITVILNRPRRSTDNGVVERDHGVLAQWVEPHQCRTWQDCQVQLEAAITMQRARYPAVKRRPRLHAYPSLRTNPRPYVRSEEANRWSFERVCHWLAQSVFYRRVDKVGRISVLSTAYTVGHAYARQEVTVRFDPHRRQWVVTDERGQVLQRHNAREISADNIQHLSLAKRHQRAN